MDKNVCNIPHEYNNKRLFCWLTFIRWDNECNFRTKTFFIFSCGGENLSAFVRLANGYDTIHRPMHNTHTHMNGQSKYKFFPSGFLTALSANVQSLSLFVRPQCRSLELSPYIHNSNDIMPFFLRSSLCSLPCSWLKSNTKSQTSPVQMTNVKMVTDTNFLRIPSKLISHLCRFYGFLFQFFGNSMC